MSYTSAHLHDVDSELVVDADHRAVHRHPLTIREVKRILLQHLVESRRIGPLEPMIAGDGAESGVRQAENLDPAPTPAIASRP